MAVYEYDSQNEELKRIAGGTLYADSPIGAEIKYAGSDTPIGFLEEDGSTFSTTDYPELYAVLGTNTLPNNAGWMIKAKNVGVPADFIKEVSKLNSYSTDEINTGTTWIDGKPIYRKVVDIGNLPNATTKSVVHNISNLGQVITIKGIAKRTSDNAYFPIPWVSTYASFQYNYTIYITQTDVVVGTLTDRTSETAVAIVEYTKTTD